MIRAGMFAAVCLLAGCGTTSMPSRVSEADIRSEDALQRRLALDIELERRQRVFDVVYRLARAAAPDCAGGQPMSGIELGGAGLVPRDYAEAAGTLGLDATVRVMAVAETSPAYQAGIRLGDVVEAIGGRPVDTGPHAYREATFALRDRLAEGPASVTLRRAGQAHTAMWRGEAGCATDLFITREALPTPKANGKAVLLPVSLVRQLRREDELAAVLAFLMAYNIRGHADSGQDAAPSQRRDLSALIGEDESNLFQPPRPLDYLGVREADAYAVELARRAGYDPARVVYFWRRYLVTTPVLVEDLGWGRALAGPARLARLQDLVDGRPAP